MILVSGCCWNRNRSVAMKYTIKILNIWTPQKFAIDLWWGKMKIGIHCYVIADILTNFYRNVPWVAHYQTYHYCWNRLIWLVAMATERLNLQKCITKSSPQNIKLKLCAFYCRFSCAFIARASFHWLTMRKAKILCQTYMYYLCPNLWIVLVTMATKRLNLRKKIFKNHLRSHKWDNKNTKVHSFKSSEDIRNKVHCRWAWLRSFCSKSLTSDPVMTLQQKPEENMLQFCETWQNCL